MATIKSEILALNANGATQDQMIANLRASGITIAEAIKQVRGIYQIPLAEAKRLVCLHPAWSAVAAASEAMQDECFSAIEKSAD